MKYKRKECKIAKKIEHLSVLDFEGTPFSCKRTRYKKTPLIGQGIPFLSNRIYFYSRHE